MPSRAAGAGRRPGEDGPGRPRDRRRYGAAVPTRDLPVDPRGPRFSAAMTSVVLAVVLLTSSTALLAAQAVVFALGAVRGPAASPWAPVFRRVLRPRLAPPGELEDVAPLRTAQAVGLAFAVVGVLGGLLGADAVLLGATAAALLAALLNAVVGLCLGCEMHLRVVRARRALGRPGGPRAARPPDPEPGPTPAPTPTTQTQEVAP